MKVITWNLWNKNPDQFTSIKFLMDLGAEVICLQEVLLETIIRLQSFANSPENKDEKGSKWQVFQALDHRDATTQHYLVILTKIPVCRHFCDYLDSTPPYSFLAKRHKIQSVRQFHYVDLIYQNTKFRIFNIHLEVAVGPRRRLLQFDNLVKNFGETNVVCGDFNVFPHPLGNLFLGWAASFSLGDYTTNERKKFEEKFKKLNLNNVFRKRVTYPRYKLQLDHILVPKNMEILEKKVGKKTTSSDHYWLYCEFEKR